MARRFGLLPAAADVAGAVRWAWKKFLGSSDAAALDPEEQAITNLRSWIAERWGSSIHPTVPDDHGRAPPRDAKGWYDDNAVYLPKRLLIEAAGGALKELEIGRVLDAQGFIAKRKSPRHLYTNFVPNVGAVDAYALSRKAFGRSNLQEPVFAVHEGGRT